MQRLDSTVQNRRRLRDIDKLPKRDQEALLRAIDIFMSRA